MSPKKSYIRWGWKGVKLLVFSPRESDTPTAMEPHTQSAACQGRCPGFSVQSYYWGFVV